MTSNLKISGLFLASALLLGTAAASMPGQAFAASVSIRAQAATNVTFTLNGTSLSAKGQIGSGTALIPLSILRDGLGIHVVYNNKNKTYTLTQGQLQVKAVPGPNGATITVNGGLQPAYYEWRNTNGSNLVSVHLLTDFFGYRSQWNAATSTVSLAKVRLNDIRYTTASINKSDSITTISVQYPVISGLKNAEVQTKINQSLKNKAEAYVKASLDKSKELGTGPTGTKNEFQSHYTVSYNEKGIISFREIRYEYYGGAHGADIVEGFTYSLNSGKQLELSDLLKTGGNYTQKIDQLIASKLKKEPNYLGGFKTLGKNPGYYLKNGSLVIYFQEYEYVPYAQGLLEYAIPFSALLPEGTDPFAGL
ncbi:hypothetical protein AWM70_16145 [Paenibacillus yonginensis]|uniref:DUF3298 domain-containing protein n=1 Tax=Paenibacillus yonginensis TaxID=1462996 RepID=A0A1B1N3B9_9BACL|nr:DUF4163 domain-containing protein [Paenibacillus yonginensis]ANS75928.1 hypothetical protein AWM70_16145 [Paenibacillus yonginensis]